MKPSILKAAIDLAESISASIIIIISDSPSTSHPETDIPVLISKRSGDLGPGIHQKTLEEASSIVGGATERGAGQLQDVTLSAYVSGYLNDGGAIVGVVESPGATGIIVFDPRETPAMKNLEECSDRVDSEVLRAILGIAGEIGREGREGEAVGTAFIVGDTEEVLQRSHQLILNPFKGHEEVVITNEDNWETVKEFATLDGVFIIDEGGHIIAAGRYLDVDAKDVDVEKGLGGRHVAAAAISRDTQAIAITVSESGSIIRVYKDGERILRLEPSKVLRGVGGA